MKFEIGMVLDYELEDDNTELGGVSFLGETVRDFIGDNEYDSLEELNKDLIKCGIKPIKMKKKEIKIENVKLIIDMLHNVARICSELDEHTYRLYELAMFIVSRYGDLDSLSYEQNTEITSEHLQKISDILAEHETFFDENMLLDIEDLFLEED